MKKASLLFLIALSASLIGLMTRADNKQYTEQPEGCYVVSQIDGKITKRCPVSLNLIGATDTSTIGSDVMIANGAYADLNLIIASGMNVGDLSDSTLARILINFDLPAGTGTISDLKLYMWSSDSSLGGTTTIHSVSRTNWVEDEATWNIYKTGSSWTTGGGDFSATIIDTDDNNCSPITDELHSWALVGASSTNPMSLSLGDSVNLIIKNDNTGGELCYFYDDRNVDPAVHPYFEITYTTSTPSATNNIIYSSTGL